MEQQIKTPNIILLADNVLVKGDPRPDKTQGGID
jgi:hypothetical protein